MIALVFDTETTGLIENLLVNSDRQPEIIEWASILVDIDSGEVVSEHETLVRPILSGGRLPADIVRITGITQDLVDGARPFSEVAEDIRRIVEAAPAVLGHNVRFDMEMVDLEFRRLKAPPVSWPAETICTVEQSAHYAGRRLKLSDLHKHVLGETFPGAHRAMVDVRALVNVAIEMRRRGDL